MSPTLSAKIEDAKAAVGQAEQDLRKLVGSKLVTARAQKVEMSDAVRTAFSKLAEAKAQLVVLDTSLALSNLEAAKTAIVEAEQNLDRLVRELKVAEGSDNTLVTDVVADALGQLTRAKSTLVDLEKTVVEKDR